MDTELGLRFAEGSDDVIEGWLVPYGGHLNGRDTYHTRATPETDFALPLFPDGARPLLFHHGLAEGTNVTPVGRIRTLEPRDKGLWMQAQLDARNEYINEIRELVKSGALGLSSGALAHLVEIDEKTGNWKRWPIVEGSLTPTPSNLLATIDGYSFASAVRSAGFDRAAALVEREMEYDPQIVHTEAERAKLTAKERDSLKDSDFAYVDSDGNRHLPIHDAEHLRNAIARFSQTEFESEDAKAAARKKIMAAAKKLGVDVSEDSLRSVPTLSAFSTTTNAGTFTLGGSVVMDGSTVTTRANVAADSIPYERSFEDIREDIMELLNPVTPYGYGSYSYIEATFPDFVIVCRCEEGEDDSHWRIAYTLGPDDEPVLGEATQVEQVFIPVAARSALLPLTMDAGRLSRDAAAICERTKDLADRRIREGRVFSTSNRKAINDAVAKAEAAVQALKDLITSTDKQADEAARAADPLWWQWQQAQLEALALL